MNSLRYCLIAASVCAAVFPSLTASANFNEAQAYIDVDGSLVGYIDFEGDGRKIGDTLNEIYAQIVAASPEMPPIPVDFTQLIDTLGFGSLKAIAISSKEVEPGLHSNRSVALMQDEPTGLFALYATEPLTFTAAEKAPADATAALTASINLIPLRSTATQILQQIMGPMGEAMVQQQLAQAIPQTDITYDEAIERLSGKWDVFWHQSYRENFQQDVKFWVSIEGAGKLLPRLRSMSEQMGVAFIEDDTTLKANFSPLLGPDATVGLYVEAPKQSGELIIHSHRDWTPDSDGPRLVDQPAFKNLADRLPGEGIAFSYSRGADLDPMLGMMDAIPGAAPYKQASESALDLLIGGFLKPNMSVTHIEDGHWIGDQYAGYSTKQVITTIPAVIGAGMGAAMAIPAFEKVRETSREKAVQNNLRQIATAAQQYFLENGVTKVHIDELIGEDGYIRQPTPVAGESYEGLILRSGEPIRVTLGDGTVMTQDL
ncbi:MAG: hypothetical protein GVY36_10320 [Verrucomicrobia bacterium]|jgi:type IV pilus assembly protein PilA|nr:hypothetical protein [Verrucomicrobiota bacterium]